MLATFPRRAMPTVALLQAQGTRGRWRSSPVVGVLLAIAGVLALGPGAPPAAAQSGHTTLRVTVGSMKPLGVETPKTVKVRVRNTGHRSASNVRLRVKAPKGVTVSPHRTRVKRRLAAGASRRITVRVTRTARARDRTTVRLRFSATASHARTARRTLSVARGLAGRAFWSADPFDEIAYTSYYFVDDRWAYRGAPTGGLPTSCTTAVADGEGCVRYRYDPHSGKLTVGDQTGKVERHGADLSVDDQSYGELVPPAAGARYAVGWSSISGSGTCAIDCVFGVSGLTLTQDGQFARTLAVTGSVGGAGGSAFAVLPADMHGSYAIKDHGQIQLRYADGHVETATFLVFLQHDQPDPGYGILLNGTLYTGPDF